MRDLDRIEERPEDGRGRQLGTIVMALIAFVGLSTAVGVVIGRALRPNVADAGSDPLVELEARSGLREEAKAARTPESSAGTDPLQPSALSFPKTLQGKEDRPEVLAALAAAAEEEAELSPAQPEAGTASTARRLSETMPAFVSAGPAQRKLVEAARHDPLVEAAIPERPSSAAPASPGEEGAFTLQVISYESAAEANAFAAALRAKGHRAFVTAVDIPERGRYHRVRIGPFETRWEAQRYRDRFEDEEQMNTFVIRRPKQ